MDDLEKSAFIGVTDNTVMRPRVICGGGIFTPLYSTSDLIAHIGEWNVIWRLIVIPLLVFYAVLLNFLPYSWRESSAYKPWIKGYSIMFCLIGVFILSWLITQNTLFQISHNLCSVWFILVPPILIYSFFSTSPMSPSMQMLLLVIDSGQHASP